MASRAMMIGDMEPVGGAPPRKPPFAKEAPAPEGGGLAGANYTPETERCYNCKNFDGESECTLHNEPVDYYGHCDDFAAAESETEEREEITPEAEE